MLIAIPILIQVYFNSTLATVVGVLVEVPVMLSVCSFCNRTKHWFDTGVKAGE